MKLLCVGELNDQLVRLDFDPDDMSVDEDYILDLGGYGEVRTNRFCDESFDLVSGDPPHLGQQAGGAGFLGAYDARTRRQYRSNGR